MLSEKFNREYFEDGISHGVSLYENYRWIPELTIPLCHNIVIHAGIKPRDKILDFGCAKGYMVQGFRLLGYDAYGVDVSEYALASASREVSQYLFHSSEFTDLGRSFDICIAKDVFEHLEYDELPKVLETIRRVSKRLLVVVPLGGDEDETYTIPQMELDSTHIIRKPRRWWNYQINAAGFNVVYSNYSMGNIKDKWVDAYPTGNAFILGE